MFRNHECVSATLKILYLFFLSFFSCTNLLNVNVKDTYLNSMNYWTCKVVGVSTHMLLFLNIILNMIRS